MDYVIRYACIDDVPYLVKSLEILREYHGIKNEHVIDFEDFAHSLLNTSSNLNALILEKNARSIGFVLYFENYSTIYCKKGLYIEDLYVEEAERGQGLGKALFKKITQLASENGYAFIEWLCADKNETTIGFYLNLKAQPCKGWSVYRLEKKDYIHHLG